MKADQEYISTLNRVDKGIYLFNWKPMLPKNISFRNSTFELLCILPQKLINFQ